LISKPLGVCRSCLLGNFSSVAGHVEEVHAGTRILFSLPPRIPREKGVTCPGCANGCEIPEGGKGYCGLRENHQGSLVCLGGIPKRGLLSWYFDRLPTNCVADWVCPGHQAGGQKNLAVFYHSCTFNCLFCQNWHFRESFPGKPVSSEELAGQVDDRTYCICYFGGDPSSQMPHAIKASRLALKKKGIRICWETNGNLSRPFLKEMLRIALESGGIIKFDLKTHSEVLSLALCGVSNRTTLENFAWLAGFLPSRPSPPLLIASTLLVPGYVDEQEISSLARFIAALNPEIPYSLLGFYPHFFMKDLPTASRSQARACLKAAREAGLKNIHIGNIHLLSDDL
jgi:pyruvate formate lyase activating enzyme